MNIAKKLAALTLALLTALSIAACHPKNEIAVTIGEWEFTSAYYLCAFITADMEAQTTAYNLAMSGEAEGVDVTKEDFIYDVKIDGKKYETWVKDKALDTLKTVAAYKTLCKKNKLEISNTDKTGAEAVIAEKWSNYSEIFSNNGVSQATYTQYRLDEYLAEVYFGHLYGKDGKKAVSADDIKKHLNENYVVANVIGEDLSSLEDEQKTDKKETINGYYNELIAGTKTFEEIYKTHYNITEEDTTTNETDDKPMDQYATAISKEEGGEHFNSIMEMNVGDIKILNGENDSDILLVIKKDINADPYYLNDADITIRHELKDKEFENDINKFKKTLKLEENKYATNRFKVKKIEYLETTA